MEMFGLPVVFDDRIPAGAGFNALVVPSGMFGTTRPLNRKERRKARRGKK